MSNSQPGEWAAPGQSGVTDPPAGDASSAFVLNRWQLLLAYAAGPFAFSFGGMMRFLIPIRASELGAPLGIIGLIVGAGALVPAVTSIPSGALADRIGARWAYVLGTSASGLVALAFAFIHSYWGMLALQLVLGVFRPMSWVAAQTYITGIGAPSERATLTSRFSFATNVGSLVSPLAIGVVAQVMGFRLSFLYLVLVALLFTGIGLALPNIHRQAPTATRRASSGAGFGAALALLRLRGIQITMLLTFVRLWIGSGWTAFYPLFLINRGTPPALVGTILSSHSAVATVTALGAGRLSGRFGKEVVIAVSLALGALGIAISPQVPDIPQVYLPGILMGIGTGLSLPLLIALVSDASPEGQRGVGTGLRESVNQASSSVSPIAMGGIVGVIGMGLGFLASAAFCWLVLVAALVLHARDAQQEEKAKKVSAG